MACLGPGRAHHPCLARHLEGRPAVLEDRRQRAPDGGQPSRVRRGLLEVRARLLESMRLDDAGTSGVRAQAVGRDGTLIDDFVISETPGASHVRNAPSPAATSSLALARELVDRMELASAAP